LTIFDHFKAIFSHFQPFLPFFTIFLPYFNPHTPYCGPAAAAEAAPKRHSRQNRLKRGVFIGKMVFFVRKWFFS
jgi:hypothetical protein